jgi:hypothetical protein
LHGLVDAWVKQSGELPEVILTNICEHEARGRFPPGTFRHIGTGGWSDRGALGKLVDNARFSGYRWLRDEAAQTLNCVVVSKADVLSFCQAWHVRPPPCVAGFWRSLFWKNASHSAPPPYPSTPEEIAAERARAEQEEAAAKVEHEETLAQMAEGQLRHFELMTNYCANLAREGEEIDWDRWLPADIPDAKTYIDQMSDKVRIAGLMLQLEELQSKAAAIRRQALESESEELSGSKGARATAAAETKARLYLEEQVRSKNWLPKPDHFAAARAICGESLSERAFDRAWAEIAPPDWRKPGRRAMQ